MRTWSNDIDRDFRLADAGGEVLSYDGLRDLVARYKRALTLRSFPGTPVAVLADNSPDWMALDLAAADLGVPFVPLPGFFSPEQLAHVLKSAGVHALFCNQPGAAHALGFRDQAACGGRLALFEIGGSVPVAVPPETDKLTFTSGTTSAPKGVCLDMDQQWQVARALCERLRSLDIRRHLNLLPLPVLLENVAGVYTAMQAGAMNICVPLASTGLSGAAAFDPTVCLDTIARHRAESVIVLPQMLAAMTAAARRGDTRASSLKYVAVGGARIAPALIRAARAKGIPAYEGYGLSECCSVVSVNTPEADRIGTAGMPLPGRQVRIAGDGEIEVRVVTRTNGGARYLGSPPSPTEWVRTGDLGRLDEDGFLHVEGRMKNLLITAFGRNVSPEWPEAVLTASGPIAQAAVFGDARPYLVAAIVPAAADVTDTALAAAIERANSLLPDYARIRRWFRSGPMTDATGQATPNGRLRRDAIARLCKDQIDSLYQ